MANLTLNTNEISDWPSFHYQCAKVFGFPDFYGRNMDAWLDCLTGLTQSDGMTRFVLAEDEQLYIHVTDYEPFSKNLPEICQALLECTSFVNKRYVEAMDTPGLVLVLK